MGKEVTLQEAAKEMGVGVSTIRHMVARGAPTFRPGGVGRGNGSLVVVSELQKWRAKEKGLAVSNDEADALQKFAESLRDFYRRDSGLSGPAHKIVGVSDRDAARYLCFFFRYEAIRQGVDVDASDFVYPEAIIALAQAADLQIACR